MKKLLAGLLLSILICSCGQKQNNDNKKISTISPIRTFASSDLDCSSAFLHQKNQAICLLKNSVENNTNTEISQQIESLTKQGLKASGEYTALFLGGDDSTWAYIVSVDFYNAEKFQSIVAIVKTSSEKQASFKEVLSLSRVRNLVKD